jgi:radical SAM protein with 4Fe4S-binding SPASM domain
MKKTTIELVNGDKAVIVENDKAKILKSENYNFMFNKQNGFFARWGKTQEDDGDLGLGICEIADIEIAEICEGVPGIGPCAFCYKSNTGNKGENMSLDTFKKIFHKLPASVTQIAFGCGTLRKHPEMWDIFRYSKENGIIPNLTINGDVDDHEFDKIAELCGACAVSIYDKELSYDSIKKLTDRGMQQVNIHYMISEETYEKAFEIMDDMRTDPRLSKMKALVLLSLKTKGRSVGRYHQLGQEKFTTLTNYAIENNVSIGFDSCSAQLFMRAVKGHPNEKQFEQSAEPCESTLYSLYIDVKGDFYPCSFSPGTTGWEKGISVIDCNDFLEDIWFNEKTRKFSEGVIKCRNCKQSCSIFEI